MFIIDHHCLSPYHMIHMFGDLFDCWKNRRKTVETNRRTKHVISSSLSSFLSTSWNSGTFQPAQSGPGQLLVFVPVQLFRSPGSQATKATADRGSSEGI